MCETFQIYQGLRISIQDELCLTSPTTINQCYQLTLKVEEKFKRRNEQSGKGKGKSDRGKGNYGGRGNQKNRPQGDSKKEKIQGKSSSRGGYKVRRGNERGRNGGKNNRQIKCYNCNQIGNYTNKCPEKKNN